MFRVLGFDLGFVLWVFEFDLGFHPLGCEGLYKGLEGKKHDGCQL